MFPALLSTVLLAAAADPAPSPPPFTFEDGDRVVLIGNTLIEREQRSGYWETALTARFPKKNITFRNLGWSGDDVRGIARNSFDGSPAGFNRLRDGVIGLKPTVLIVAYGGNESFDGAAGLEKFKVDYEKLLDAIAPTKARLILVAPPRQEKMQELPLPDPTAHNKDLQLYGKAIGEIAKKRGAVFVDLYGGLADHYKVLDKPRTEKDDFPDADKLTDNGLHFTPRGYCLTSYLMSSILPKQSEWIIDFKDLKKAPETTAVRIGVPVLQGDTVRFAVLDDALPTLTSPPEYRSKDERHGEGISTTIHSSHTQYYIRPGRIVRFHGLPQGRYTLTIDGQKVAAGDAKEWAEGVHVDEGPDYDQAEKLRAAIIEKNRLFFHRWRPQNETYLFGFRKGEQGQNAREVPLFEPLVVKAQEEIAKLRVPAEPDGQFFR